VGRNLAEAVEQSIDDTGLRKYRIGRQLYRFSFSVVELSQNMRRQSGQANELFQITPHVNDFQTLSQH